MKNLTVLYFLLLFSASPAQDTSCQLVVKVENISEVKGKLKLGIFNDQSKFLKTAVSWGDTIITDNSATFIFDGLKKGIYAVSIYQDTNENGKLDANFLGIPSEPYAFSNNARGRFGPPSFEECKFELQEKTQITIEL